MSARPSPPRAAALLGAPLLGAVLLALGCEVDLERMLEQRKAEAYEASSAFADGMAMRTPPAGTVPALAPTGPEELLSGRSAAGYVTALPLLVSAELLERGQDRYQIFCRPCHGAQGDGETAVARSMLLRRPLSLLDARARALPAGAVYRAISEGYGLMPSYAAQLAVSDRWAVVAYVQALALSQSLRLAELPEELRREAEPWLR